MYSLSEEISMTARVRELNDELRQRPHQSAPKWVITQGVAAKGSEFVNRAVQETMSYGYFTPDNDPHGEHDFGSFTIHGETVFWKIDYYEKGSDYMYGSPDPSDPEKTDRVLTLMLAHEY